MQVRNLFRAVQPFVLALAVITTAAVLVVTMFFTELGAQWTTFLAGILVAAVLAEATRVSRAEWVSLRRTAQLGNVREKLDHEMQLRKKAAAAIDASKPRLQLIDEVLPTMVAFIDIEGRCQYHNRALMKWLRVRPKQVHGRHMREVLGAKTYQETAAAVRQSLEGHSVRYERMQKMPDGAVYQLSVEHIPQFGEDGKVSGFHMLINDITSPGDVHTTERPESGGAALAGNGAATHVPVHDGEASQNMYVGSVTEQITGQKNVDRIKEAIERGAFRLFCQMISPLAVDAGEAEHYEILVRLIEEEQKLIPPGAFIPLAEKYGLMTHLDRWVIQHVAEWASIHNPPDEKRKSSMFFINVSSATIGDPGFPEFLQLTLKEHGIPGAALCFEIPNSELGSRALVVAEFARQVGRRGCRVAINGFGRDKILFDLIRGFRVDFFNIDGSIIFNILRDPVDLAKVTAINQVAQKIGVKTIADELVENEATTAKLREIGVGFAQGFGIMRPQPLAG